MGFFTLDKIVAVLGVLILGGSIYSFGSFTIENHNLKNRIGQLESDLLDKYIQINTLNQELAKQAEEMNKVNSSFERYRVRVQERYTVSPSSNPCDASMLSNLLYKWRDKK